jgi:hypothetical protein
VNEVQRPQAVYSKSISPLTEVNAQKRSDRLQNTTGVNHDVPGCPVIPERIRQLIDTRRHTDIERVQRSSEFPQMRQGRIPCAIGPGYSNAITKVPHRQMGPDITADGDDEYALISIHLKVSSD